MQCPNCHYDIPSGMQVCPTCNQKVENLFKEEVDNTSKKKKKLPFGISITLILLGIILVFAILIIVISKLLEDKKPVSNFDKNSHPILFKENGLYGYMNSYGEAVIKPQYKYAGEFVGNYATVSNDYKKDNQVNSINVIDIYNNTKYKLSSSSKITYYEDKGTYHIENALYNLGLQKISGNKIVANCDKNYCIGYDSKHKVATAIDHEGNEVFSLETKTGFMAYEAAADFDDFQNVYCRVNLDNEKYAIVNCKTGKIMHDFSTDMLVIKGPNLFAYIDAHYNTLETMYIVNDDLYFYTKDPQVVLLYESGKSYFQAYNHNEDPSIKMEYLYLDNLEFSTELKENYVDYFYTKQSGVSAVKENDKYGLVKDDKLITNIEYDNVYTFDTKLYKNLLTKGKDYILLEKNNKLLLVDVSKNAVVYTFNTKSLENMDELNSNFIYYKDSATDDYVIYNLYNNQVKTISNTGGIIIREDYIIIKDHDRFKFYNNELDLIYDGESF